MINDNFYECVKSEKFIINDKKDVLFFCIGTTRVIGDSLGPITGSLLKNKYCKEQVYGDLENNLTYINITERINEAKYKFKNPLIIAVDAALSERKNIGKIFVDYNGIDYGSSLSKKDNRRIGDIGIKVVVGENLHDNSLNFKTLQNVSFKRAIELSKQTFEVINRILNK